ncbi:ATP-dependent kinase-like protein notR' [Pseudocercospora fuligena]|uniref:ATP-dependent kinase-like protein notR n=1 Tax=Pseudocercospora fuligena TaxID=685502 RepID=A0A8H6VJ58_9PEZI|nr:ATP-dependent kinase-like protein notR' [Pseudocercospora fuligena]
MEEQVERLVNKVWNKFQDLPQSKRYLVAVSGIPGSGKTTLAAKVADLLNRRWRNETAARPGNDAIATFLPMDGYHLTRAQLSAMPDPANAHARRGAAFTFDAPAFLKLVKMLREPICPETGTLYAPSFDHAVKDPVENDRPIRKQSRIVVMEGNYLSLGSGASEWKEAAEMMDESWFVDVDREVARKRLIARHVTSGIAKDESDAAKRADENDLVNGDEIISGRMEVHEIVKSQEDKTWTPEQQGIEKERDAEEHERRNSQMKDVI